MKEEDKIRIEATAKSLYPFPNSKGLGRQGYIRGAMAEHERSDARISELEAEVEKCRKQFYDAIRNEKV